MGRVAKIKPLEEMNLIDDFLNNAVASYKPIGEEIFRIILEVLLDKKIGAIEVKNQVVLSPASPELRGVRLDVEINESDECGNTVSVYDYEPHTAPDMNFMLANRYRQAKIDSKSMRKGDRDFSHMPELYVITITNFDIFGKDYMVYTVRNTFQETTEIDYSDKLRFIYFNTTGTKGGSVAIKNMLTYIQTSKSSNAVDDATKRVDSLVSRAKNLEEVRAGYMTFGDKLDNYFRLHKDELLAEAKEELLAKAKEEAIAEGKELGIEEGYAKGREEGFSEGVAAGRKEALIEAEIMIRQERERADLEIVKLQERLSALEKAIAN